MRRREAVLLVAALLALNAASLLLPWPAAVLVGAAGIALRRRGRVAIVAFAALACAINAALFGIQWAWWAPGFLALRLDYARLGIVAALQLSAVVAINLGVLDRRPAAAILDGLRLPMRWTAFLGALTLAAHGVGQDLRAHLLARRLEGRRGRVARLRAVAAAIPWLVVAGLRRAHTRAEALRLAGHETGARFAPVLAIAALAAASRMALAPLANVKPTYAVVFLGGLLFGSRVGAAAGAIAMLATDLLLSGLMLSPLVNVPAMALLGGLGGALRRLDWTGRAAPLLSGLVGFYATMLFSVASDALTWLVLPTLWPIPGSLGLRILLGLQFNVIPAIANGLIFAVAAPAAVRAWEAVAALREAAPAAPTSSSGARPTS
jgi:hypothetical protein